MALLVAHTTLLEISCTGSNALHSLHVGYHFMLFLSSADFFQS